MVRERVASEPTGTSPADKLRASAAEPGILAVAMGVMNIATYGFQILASRTLGPASFGAFAAVMNMLLLIGVGQLALQATAARRISAAPGEVRGIERATLRLTYRSSLALGLAMLVLAPAVNALLRLDNLAMAALLAVIAVPHTVLGGQAGVLQGERRWRPLALLYLSAGVPRLVLGGLMIAIRPEPFAALVGVGLGALVPVAVGAVALRRPRGTGATPTPRLPGLAAEAGHKALALLAFVALCNVDLIIARNVLDEHDAGQYAAGLILTKAVLFLPQFVVVIAFPSLSTAHERRRALIRGLGLITLCGVATIIGVSVLSSVALIFVGGDDYAEIQGDLWLFAVLGLLLALIQMLVYAVLATEARLVTWLPWLAVVAITVTGSMATTVTGLVITVVIVNAVLTAILLAIAVRSIRVR
ncbi:lipopolysaccharide biosynthesis protein [Nocardioides sambongensis]|uniref:lipopolysaccharide biosynthesis protein n=1 Tax=Nocardioides sambongensis TaxID=2589074 RepID=UPI001E32F9AC|nr:polysaccharide biosynthesis protein [Nocardioides sambongensis]